MTKLRRFHEENYPYFITTSTAGRERVFQDRAKAELLKEVLYQTRVRYGFLLLGFAIMPDHLHAVIVPRLGDTISQVMRFVKGTYARAHNVLYDSSGPFWQPRFYDRAVRDEEALRATITYVEQNPVKAKLAGTPQDYPFSSAHPKCPTDLEAFLNGQA
ncbi:MAG: transposase [Chloroflexi bacterium]|nr:transposase [Chloroflexota bacterium]